MNNIQDITHSNAPTPRAKRSQVAKACDWCRAHRIKCDNNHPCHNCQSRGGLCNNPGANEIRTLPHAIREIESLRLYIKKLEDQVKSQALQLAPSNDSRNLALSSPVGSPMKGLSPSREHGATKKRWEGIYASTTSSHQSQYYGPSSSFYFIGRIATYLAAVLQQPQSELQMQPNSASRSFASPTVPKRGTIEFGDGSSDTAIGGDCLTKTQEDYYLGLFWQSYHPTYHIIDESTFREHYNSLWAIQGGPRKPSALVDIILAICMQYGVAFIPRSISSMDTKADVNANDATIAGRWLYYRCQAQLTSETESPTISTLQCFIFSVVYLCNASFQNMAHTLLALSVRIAQTLGLHLEPPENMPQVQRELRKRLWWTLFTVESKTCMKLGRPWSVQLSEVTCSLPNDDSSVAMLVGFSFAKVDESVTILTYPLQSTKLLLAARAIYARFYDHCNSILSSHGIKTLYEDSRSLESAAEFLSESMKCLQEWLHELPEALKSKRKSSGESYSTDRSTILVERLAPMWLQRQRLILELLYHNLAMNLYRPLICFSPTISSRAPLAEGISISCLDHAITITNIMYQILTETDILNGWHEAYQWQWNATLSMIGFMLAYPVSPSAPSARRAIKSAIEVFERLGDNFAVASSAANITRELSSKADLLIDRFRNNLTLGTPQTASGSPAVTTIHASSYQDPRSVDSDVGIFPQFEEHERMMVPNDLTDTMSLAFTVDSAAGFETFATSPDNMADTWFLTQP